AIWRTIDHVVERRRHKAKEIFETRAIGRLAGEDEAAIAFDARRLHHRGFRIFRIEIAWITVLQRHGFEPSIEMVGPAVVAALKFLRSALVVGDHERAAMGALIMDDAHLAIAVAHQNDRFAADETTNVVAGIFYLAFVADIDPGVAEYPRHFQIEDRRVS